MLGMSRAKPWPPSSPLETAAAEDDGAAGMACELLWTAAATASCRDWSCDMATWEAAAAAAATAASWPSRASISAACCGGRCAIRPESPRPGASPRAGGGRDGAANGFHADSRRGFERRQSRPSSVPFRAPNAPRPARRGARAPLPTRAARRSEALLCCVGDGKPRAGRARARHLGSAPRRAAARERPRDSAPRNGHQEGRPSGAVQSTRDQDRGTAALAPEGSGARVGREGGRRSPAPDAAASAAGGGRLGRGGDCRDGPGVGARAG
mmetsp:Transcript_8400/g.33150  ORF Transcript_8400/g.33150 Transcript_8400/m.33150 type:complete len:268 (+) Transcript_8400:80-883(+)